MKRYLMVLVIFVIVACQKNGGDTPPQNNNNNNSQNNSQPPANNETTGTDEVLATVNGESIKDSEVSAQAKDQLDEIATQIYKVKKAALRDLIEDKLLTAEAKKKNITVEALLKQQIEDKVKAPTDAEIQKFYIDNQKRFKNQPLENVKDEVINQLKNSSKSKLYNEYVDKLKKSADVAILIKSPPRPRVEVALGNSPSKGKVGAPVTIVEFSEFQCPYCKRARPTVQKILDTYGDKVHYVFRNFPLPFHDKARKAAEASLCANDQKKYWQYNEYLWEKFPAITVDNLKSYAKDVGLNTSKFNECLDSGAHSADIDQDIADGKKAGVSGTPAYLINGIFVSGAQPFEEFQDIIDDELQRLGK